MYTEQIYVFFITYTKHISCLTYENSTISTGFNLPFDHVLISQTSRIGNKHHLLRNY